MQYLLGHSSPMMVRRYSATYDSEQAAVAHAAFSPATQLSGTIKTAEGLPASDDDGSVVWVDLFSAARSVR